MKIIFYVDVPASGMYFLTYEYIKRKIVESAPEGTKASRSRELGGTVFAGGMGKNSFLNLLI